MSEGSLVTSESCKYIDNSSKEAAQIIANQKKRNTEKFDDMVEGKIKQNAKQNEMRYDYNTDEICLPAVK